MKHNMAHLQKSTAETPGQISYAETAWKQYVAETVGNKWETFAETVWNMPHF